MNKYDAKIHKDGAISVWNAYTQQWETRTAEAQMHHESWASTSLRDRARIEAAANGRTLAKACRLARQIKAQAHGTNIAARGALKSAGVWYASSFEFYSRGEPEHR